MGSGVSLCVDWCCKIELRLQDGSSLKSMTLVVGVLSSEIKGKECEGTSDGAGMWAGRGQAGCGGEMGGSA